jgi:hypothetical protein
MKSGNAGRLILLRGEGLVEQNPKFSPAASAVTSECFAAKYFHWLPGLLRFPAAGKSGGGGRWPDHAKSQKSSLPLCSFNDLSRAVKTLFNPL